MNQPPNNPYGAPPGPGGYGYPAGGPPAGGPPPGFGGPAAPPPGFAPPGQPNFGVPGGGGSGDAAKKVAIPATLMLVLSGLAIVASIVNIILNVLGVGLGAMSGDSDVAMSQAFSGVAGVVSAAIAIIVNAVVVFGALKMKKLESYTFSLVSAILFSLPCSVCCLVNMPIGIWAIVTLINADVKAAFRS